MAVQDDSLWTITLIVPAETRTRIEASLEVEENGIKLTILRDSQGLMSGLQLISLTTREYIPIISHNAIHEPQDPNCDRLLRAAQAFEGIFGVLGLIRLIYERASWAWHYCGPNDPEPTLYFSYSSGDEPAPIRTAPLGAPLLHKLARISLLDNTSSAPLTLNLFREGELHFHDFRYIDAIRLYYMAIEHQCANGKTGKNEAVKEIAKAAAFQYGTCNALPLINTYIRRGDISSDYVISVFSGKDHRQLSEWCFSLRGSLFHISGKRRTDDKWNPSHHTPHKQQAIIIRAICAGVAEYVLQSLL